VMAASDELTRFMHDTMPFMHVIGAGTTTL
jgi:hypothetical protein